MSTRYEGSERLNPRGFMQIDRVHYNRDEKFSPMANKSTIFMGLKLSIIHKRALRMQNLKDQHLKYMKIPVS